MSKHAVDIAVSAHTTLQTFATVVAILENGSLYDPASYGAAERIISIAKAEQQKLLRRYDKARAQAKGASA